MSPDTLQPAPAARVPGAGVLSFSAGGDIEDIHKWRLVSDLGRSVSDLGRLFPDLEQRGFLREPGQESSHRFSREAVRVQSRAGRGVLPSHL